MQRFDSACNNTASSRLIHDPPRGSRLWPLAFGHGHVWSCHRSQIMYHKVIALSSGLSLAQQARPKISAVFVFVSDQRSLIAMFVPVPIVPTFQPYDHGAVQHPTPCA